MGAAEDQWRPCSEKYFPYLPSPRPIRPPMIGGDDRYHEPRPLGSHDPGYYGRHWPITYLHREPPPNCTDSLASADNSANRRTNETTPIEKPSGATTPTTETGNDTATARTRRRRLRSRTVLDPRSQRAIVSRKTVARVRNETQGQRERVAKIERVSKRTRTEPFTAPTAITATAAPHAAVAAPNGTGAKSRRIGDEVGRGGSGAGMIQVPLIVSNTSLPLGS